MEQKGDGWTTSGRTQLPERARETFLVSRTEAKKSWFLSDILLALVSLPARERTYFSWLRLATFLAIASIALFLRLRLRIFTNENPPASVSSQSSMSATSNDATQYFARALAKKALRKRLAVQHRSGFIYDKAAYTTSSPGLTVQRPLSPYPSDDNDSDDGILDSNPLFSKLLGSFFFVLALVALIVGHIDYMRCERALEEADKLITLDEQISQNGQATRLHNAQSAKQAHSNQ